MALPSGTRLGPYEVLSPLGAGGMGEVYRARDTRLGREVAVKVLTDELADDPKALARFQAEARAVAALSHPNILGLFDVGEEGGVRYAVTELLEGETLRALLRRGAIPVRRALDIAGQVADGLASAHEAGIVHRDVKPENVFLTKDGRAKVLDFGLARQRSPSSSPGGEDTPTASVLTDPGTVLGTFAYMSPEQASGSSADHHSDQFSLGVVLYEMLTGKRPFGGATSAETLAAIIREEPEPLEARAPKAPAPVRWLVDRLLSKDPHGRYDTTRDLARELKTLSLHASGSGMSTGSARRTGEGRRSWRSLSGAAAAAIAAAGVLATALATVAFLKGTARPPSPPVRLEIRLPEGHYLFRGQRAFALSPDGKLLIFSAFSWKKPFEEENDPKLFLRPLESFAAQPIPGTEGGTQPVFSPDGRNVAFIVSSESGTLLKRVPLAGGPATTICRCDARFGAAWSADGSILFGSHTGPLQKVPATGGTPEPATKLDAAEGEVSHRLPHLLPDGRTILYTALRWKVMGNTWETARIFAQRSGDKERSLLAEGGSDGRWVPPGYLVFAREGSLLAAPFDAGTLRLGGMPVPILEGVSHSIWWETGRLETGVAGLDTSGTRILAWLPGSVTPPYPTSLVWLDESGRETPLDLPKGSFLGGRVSPDGERLLVSYIYPGKQAEALDLSRGGHRNVTFEMSPLFSIWGPGPDRITLTSNHEGPTRIYSRKIDAGPGEIDTLWKGEGTNLPALGSWSRDGKTLTFIVVNPKTATDIWLLETGKEPRSFVATPFNEIHPDISPDGRWLLYTTDEPGQNEVFVRPLTGEGSTRQVSVGGGSEALWSRDGTAILYRGSTPKSASQPNGARALLRVRVNAGGGELAFGPPQKILDDHYDRGNPGHTWDVAPDGRFVFGKLPDPTERRAWLEKTLSDRIYVDLDGLPALLDGAREGR